MKIEIQKRLIQTIVDGRVFCLLSHLDPDGDSIGSELGLGNFLTRIGKTVHLYSPGPFSRPEIAEVAPQFHSRISDDVLAQRPAAVVLDCSTLDRIGDLAEDISGLDDVIVIDHHSSGRPFGDLHLIDPSIPSVTLLVQHLIEEMGYEVNENEARWLLFGFCTDTGFFRHLDSTRTDIFDALGRLSATGATLKEIYSMIYGGRPLEARVLLGTLLSRTESLLSDRLLLTYETIDDKNAYGPANRDSDALYQQLQTVNGCRVVVFIREEEEAGYTVGLRSNDSIDVGQIAANFGGGGHKRAAGFSWSGTQKVLVERIVETFTEVFDNEPAEN